MTTLSWIAELEQAVAIAGPDVFDSLRIELVRALEQHRYAELSGLALRVARLALVEPLRSRSELGPVAGSVGALAVALMHSDARDDVRGDALLALADLINVFECIGSPLRDTCRVIARSWLSELRELGAPACRRLRVGFAALTLGDLLLAHQIVGIPPGTDAPFDTDKTFGSDVAAVLRNMVGAIGHTDMPTPGNLPFHYMVTPTWHDVVEHCSDLCTDGQLDEPTLLWFARFVYHDISKKPLGDVASAAHESIWQVASYQAAHIAEREAKARRLELYGPDFPVTDTLGAGTYQVDEHLQGQGAQQLFLGHRVRDGARVLVALDGGARDLEALRRTIDYRSPGVFELAFIGAFDADSVDPQRRVEQRGTRVMVEQVTQGDWLPRIVTTADPRMAVQLGLSAGRILATAVANGVVLSRVRPEYMWAERIGDRFEVTGLSARGDAYFAKSRPDMVTHPVFDRFYFAPETYMGSADERSVVFTLATMIAEWASRYPFQISYGIYGQLEDHYPLELPESLAGVLSRALRQAPGERPSLAAFLAELAACSR